MATSRVHEKLVAAHCSCQGDGVRKGLQMFGRAKEVLTEMLLPTPSNLDLTRPEGDLARMLAAATATFTGVRSAVRLLHSKCRTRVEVLTP